MNIERLVRIEQRTPTTTRKYVTTSTFVSRWLDRAGIPARRELTDAEYAWLMRRSSDLADRWNRRFGAALATRIAAREPDPA